MLSRTKSRALPIEIRVTLACAGSLLPPSLRGEWIREWHAEFWHSFAGHQKQSPVRHQMRLRALGAFADAWTVLQLDWGFRRRVRDAIESRLASVLIMSAVLISMAVATGGFKTARRFLLHDKENGLVLVAQPNPFLGGNWMIPSAEAEAWAQHSKVATEAGRWLVQEEKTRGHRERILRADVNVMKLFSEAEVRPRFDRIEPMGIEAPAFVGVVARLRNGATGQAAEELAQVAGLHKGWQRPVVIPIDEIRRAPLVPVGSVLLVWMLFTALPLRHFRLAAWPWAFSNVGLCYSIIAASWTDLVARAPVTETGGVPAAWSWALYALPICASAGASWWLRWDARRRCRTCYRIWRTPASIGLPGRCLLDPSGHGYLCDEGHGAIWEVPLLGAFEQGTYS